MNLTHTYPPVDPSAAAAATEELPEGVVESQVSNADRSTPADGVGKGEQEEGEGGLEQEERIRLSPDILWAEMLRLQVRRLCTY
jgi:hypothetical protein